MSLSDKERLRRCAPRLRAAFHTKTDVDNNINTIDISSINDGVRQLLFQWAQEEGASKDALDPALLDFATFTGFLMLGPELGARPLGPDGVTTMINLLEAALVQDLKEEYFVEASTDVRLVKLILATGLADRDIEAMVKLEDTTS